MAVVIAIEGLPSLTPPEKRLLEDALVESGREWNRKTLAVYVVRERVREDEIEHLELSEEDVAELEAPKKLVARHNKRIKIGSIVQNHADVWTQTKVRIAH